MNKRNNRFDVLKGKQKNVFTIKDNKYSKQFIRQAKNDKFYLIDHNAYKKALFHAHEKDFLEECKPFYHKSKDFYVTRKFTYNSFVNIVRQICKLRLFRCLCSLMNYLNMQF